MVYRLNNPVYIISSMKSSLLKRLDAIRMMNFPFLVRQLIRIYRISVIGTPSNIISLANIISIFSSSYLRVESNLTVVQSNYLNTTLSN